MPSTLIGAFSGGAALASGDPYFLPAHAPASGILSVRVAVPASVSGFVRVFWEYF